MVEEEKETDKIVVQESSGLSVAEGYLTEKPEERTELTKGEIRGLAVVEAISHDMKWNLLDGICQEYYLLMRSHRRKGIEEDIQLISGILKKVEEEANEEEKF